MALIQYQGKSFSNKEHSELPYVLVINQFASYFSLQKLHIRKKIVLILQVIGLKALKVLKSLTQLKELKSLEIQNQLLSAKHLEAISTINNLQQLKLKKCQSINYLQISYLSRMEKLTKIQFNSIKNISGSVLKDIFQNFTKLKSLKFDSCRFQDIRIFQKITNLEQLESFSLRSSAVSNIIKLYLLSVLHNIQQLNLSYHGISIEDLTMLHHKSKNLKRLQFSVCGITDQHLCIISQIKHLEELDLSFNIGITHLGIQRLVSLNQSLKVLKLKDCQRLSQTALIHISKLLKLKQLYLKDCEIKDRGAVYLRTLKNLEFLEIQQNKLSYRTIENLIQNFPKMKNIKFSCYRSHLVVLSSKLYDLSLKRFEDNIKQIIQNIEVK